MGLVTLPVLGIQYFSFSEEIQALMAKALIFIENIAPVWIILILGVTLAFLAAGVFYRFAVETEGLFK